MRTNIHVLLVFHKVGRLKPRAGKLVIVAHRAGGLMACCPAKFDGEHFIDFDGMRVASVDAWAHVPRHYDDLRRW